MISTAAIKRRRLKARLFWRSIINWMHGLAFSPIERCRMCDHTVYDADRRGCRYCP